MLCCVLHRTQPLTEFLLLVLQGQFLLPLDWASFAFSAFLLNSILGFCLFVQLSASVLLIDDSLILH